VKCNDCADRADDAPRHDGRGSPITPAPQVEVRDAQGNRVTTSTAAVTITLVGGTGLSGGAATAAVAGVATFGNLRISQEGNGRRLQAASPGLTNATSNPFNIN
jgi:hypothetical protein